MSIYLDNAATSFPKPAAVHEQMLRAMTEIGASPGRGAYKQAREASGIVESAREKTGRLLGVSDSRQVVFTMNATESINVVLKGWLRAGDRVLISSMEHNAVIRPLRRLEEMNVRVKRISCSREGQLDLQDLKISMKPPPRLVVLVHASNVNGALNPAEEVAGICEEHDVPLLLDAAQTAGVQPIFAEKWKLGMLACSGHKALLGPPGLGVLYVRPDLNVLPLVEGGTGSRSEEELQPELSPDRFESGTPNLPAIAGLAAGIDEILKRDLSSIAEHEIGLASALEGGLAELPGVRVCSPKTRGTGAVSFTVDGLNPGDVGRLLDEGFDIAVRTGLHCAPLAHQCLGTFPYGTVRASPGYSNSMDDIKEFLWALEVLLAYRRKS
jgi:cysteine desulfurase family protein